MSAFEFLLLVIASLVLLELYKVTNALRRIADSLEGDDSEPPPAHPNCRSYITADDDRTAAVDQEELP